MLTPNTIFFSRLLKDMFPHVVREIEAKLNKHSIKPKWLDHTNDIWVRDFMPLQRDETYFIHYTYYPDYLMGGIEDRASITNPIRLEQQLLILHDKVVVNLPLILDGGNAVITNRHVIMTEKVLYENQRGKYNNKGAITRQIVKKLKLEPIFIPWDAPKWNGNPKVEKYGHTDWIVRYLGGDSNMVVVAFNEELTRHISNAAYKQLKDIGGYNVQKFELDNPTSKSWAYLNYVQVGNIVLVPTVAEPDNDDEAVENLHTLFKMAGHDVIIETIDCQDLIKHGGALHCVSWNVNL